MATRFRLTADTTAPAVSPAIQTYTHDQGSRRKILTSDASALTTSAYTPDAADHLVAGDAHHIQFVSDPMDSGLVFTSGNTLKYAIQGIEPSPGDNMRNQIFVSIVDSAGTTVQATIRSKVVNTANELNTSLTNKFHTTTLDASYTTVAGDRLVIEFSVQGTPTSGGGVQGHNASLRWGSDGAGGDLSENQTDTGTTLNPWIEFVTDITFQGGATTVTPAVIAVTASLPTPTILAASTVTPAAVAAVATLPTPSILAASLVTPAAVAVVAALPTPSILAAALVAPATITVITALPTPTIVVEGGATTVTPATISVLAALPTPTILAAAVVTPAGIVIPVALPTPVAAAGAVVLPGVIGLVVALPTPTILAAVTVTPATITVLTGFPTPLILVPATVTPATIGLIVALPTPLIIVAVPTFWQPAPVAYTLNPAAYVPVRAGDDPPW